jgi:hypothetical protein
METFLIGRDVKVKVHNGIYEWIRSGQLDDIDQLSTFPGISRDLNDRRETALPEEIYLTATAGSIRVIECVRIESSPRKELGDSLKYRRRDTLNLLRWP